MKQMKQSYIIHTALTLAGLIGLATAQAGEVWPDEITMGSSSYTTADGLVTLTPYATGLTAGMFAGNADIFGVMGGGSDGVNDTDGKPDTIADREAINIKLDSTAGLSQIAFAWARADGSAPTSGIVISGFTADPGASTGGETAGIRYDAATGSLYLKIMNWTGTAKVYDFTNLAASAGQELRLSVNDLDKAGPAASITFIAYDAAP